MADPPRPSLQRLIAEGHVRRNQIAMRGFRIEGLPIGPFWWPRSVLEDDIYFKVHRLSHNLDRCRTQFKLVPSIEEQEEKMERSVNSI